jgi:membrane protease YdiL (CAAX protease family)
LIQREGNARFLAYLMLLGAAMIMSRSVRGIPSFGAVFGLDMFNRKVLVFSLAGFVTGIALAVLNNHLLGVHLLPDTLTAFALLAPLIGIAEELVFRGYIQGRVLSLGPLFSILIASGGHTFYKYLVIKTYPGDLLDTYTWLVLLTFGVGTVFGWMRLRSESVIPAALAHAVFDIAVYGGLQSIPVWV